MNADCIYNPECLFQGNHQAMILSICLACFILASYVSGALISQPESSLSMGGMLNKLTGENAYALMSVLGANIMPHNFYLHSSIVQVSLSFAVAQLSFVTFYVEPIDIS